MSDVLDVAPQTTLAPITNGRLEIGEDRMYDRLERGWAMTSAVEIPTWPYRHDHMMIWHRPA
jgi:hypothetical protein